MPSSSRHLSARRSLSALLGTALTAGALTSVAAFAPAGATGTAVSCIGTGVAVQPGVWTQPAGNNVPLQDRAEIGSGGTNLIQNGNFESTWIQGDTYRLLPAGTNNSSPSNAETLKVIPQWTASGGGPAATSDTYAGWGDTSRWATTNVQDGLAQSVLPGDSMVYFGNGSGWAWRGQLPTFNSDGFGYSRPAGSIWFAAYGNEDPTVVDPAYGSNASPVRISQDVTLTPGVMYRLQFWQTLEGTDGTGTFNNDGLALLDITGYERTLFKVKTTNQRYSLDFIATSANTTISFGSWGHVDLSLAAGEVNVTATELGLDDVILTECATGTGGGPAPTPTIAAVDDSYVTPLNTPMTAGAAGALDTYDAGSTFTKLTNPAHGTVTGWNSATGTFTYTPSQDWTGTDSFTYEVCLPSPNQTVCDTATETIVVQGLPRTVDDYYTTPMDTPMTTGLASALDTYPAGSTFYALNWFTGGGLPAPVLPQHGTVTNWDPATGSFTYTPDPGWTGTDSFTYLFCTPDWTDTCDRVATEYITVTGGGGGSTPTITAVDDYYRTPLNTPTTKGNAKKLDSSPETLAGASFTRISSPGFGSVSGWDPATGKFTYVPNTDYFGTDSFDYTVCLPAPNETVCDTATEYIVIPAPAPTSRPVTPPFLRDFGVNPTAMLHTFDPLTSFVASKGATVVSSTLQIGQPGSAPRSSTIVIPGKGTFTVVNGKVRFKGVPGFSGKVTIPYRAQDTSGQWAASKLTVLVARTHPTAVPLERDLGVNITAAGTRFQAFNAFTASQFSTGKVSTLRIAPVGTRSWAKSVTVPGKGLFTVNADGTVSYRGLPCFSGDVTVRYHAQDSTGQWAGSTLTVHVRAPEGKEICPV